MTETSAPARTGRRFALRVALIGAVYAVAGLLAHFASPQYLSDLTLLCYAVAEIGGAAFIVRYLRTDWASHPWGRHVMAFMVCMEIIFTLSLSRRVFGTWPGLPEILFLSSLTFAGIVWWRYRLLVNGATPQDRSRPPVDN